MGITNVAPKSFDRTGLNTPTNGVAIRLLTFVSIAALLLSAAMFLICTRHWPLCGDAALMRYVVMAAKHGSTPYKTIQDYNWPGSYVASWLFESGQQVSDQVWRLYDYCLLMVIAASSCVIAKPYTGYAALWVSCLFIVIHGRDGIDQAGQRDLCAAAFAELGIAFLIYYCRCRNRYLLLIPAAGACMAASFLIKPTLALFLLIPFMLVMDAGLTRRATVITAALVFAGELVPLGCCLLWLLMEHALLSFMQNAYTLGLYHASLGQRSIGVLIRNAVSPILGVVGFWVLAKLLAALSLGTPRMMSQDRRYLYAAATAGLVSFCVQHRGYPYQRYPFLVFLLLIIGIELAILTHCHVRHLRLIGIAAVLWSSLVVAPASTMKACRYQDMEGAVGRQMGLDVIQAGRRLNIDDLNGHVQCLDTVYGCIAALGRIGIVQSSGEMYDEFLFHAPSAKAVVMSRMRFSADLVKHSPAILVVTDRLFPSGPDNYRKLDMWPTFHQWLDKCYQLDVERTSQQAFKSMGGSVTPPGYRIYLQRQACKRDDAD